MPVGKLELEIHLPAAHSLKDRRAVVRALKDRLRARFNISVAEADPAEFGADVTPWQRARVTIAAAAADAPYLTGLLTQAGEAAAEILRGERVEIGEVEVLD